MSDKFNDEINIKPELTFESFKDEVLDINVKEEKQNEEIIEEIHLTEEEKKMVDQFVDKIEITNSNG